MKSLRRVRKRHGRCYELALKIMSREPGAERFALVHGYIGHRMPIGHAWIETGDGRVYDPVDDRYLPAAEYAASQGAVVERRYTRTEAMRMMVERDGHCGPWHPSPVGVVHRED